MNMSDNYQKSIQYMNRYVQVTTKQGMTYQGKIVKVSSNQVYLQMDQRDRNKSVHISFFPFILPLVLFDLLAIVLISQRRRFF
ncbi:hypothetical protein [Paenibacillus terrigena]|uniref:hypothetical protein n=1 Tax=Paenibacillus terrigena TaxID=369333 RepID=UPI0028D5CB31|nr:hypothetical protein [Paenibacillus terrigena]